MRIAEELVEKARAEGLAPTGPDGLLAQITKNVIQAALEAEMTEHLGYAKGLTIGEIQARPAETYGAEVSKETVSKVADAVAAELAEWQARPLEAESAPPVHPHRQNDRPHVAGTTRGWKRAPSSSRPALRRPRHRPTER